MLLQLASLLHLPTCHVESHKKVIDEIGPTNVVQVAIDKGINCVSIGCKLEDTYLSPIWIPCTTQFAS